jgi:N4-gp56 family major capsid protein
MSTLSTATSNFSSLVTALVMRRTEEILAANYVHLDAANGFSRATIIKGTNQLTFPAFAQLAANTTALSEGTPPTAQTLTISTDTVTAAQMGWTVEVTDLALLEAPQNLIAEAANLIGDQAANSMDVVVRDVLAAGASVKYAGTATSRVLVGLTDVLTGVLTKKSVGNLRKRNVPTFSDGSYHAIITPGQAYDLMSDTATGGWIDANKYQTNRALLTGEIGEFAGARFVISSNAKVFTTAGASSVDVHSGCFLGTMAYAIGDLQSLEARYVAPGGDHSDPLAQKAIVGAKVNLGAALLDAIDARYLRVETGATTL